jgi:hypothetical protein
MATKICKRSGLTFETENSRLQVHPKISYYTAHKDTTVRYPAVAVINSGAAAGWKTWEEFEAAINLALNPVFDFEGAWVAKLSGYSEAYEFDRVFLQPVKVNKYSSQFAYPEDGIYQTCCKSRSGKETRRFWLVSSGQKAEITKARVKELLGPQPVQKVTSAPDTTGCLAVEEFLGEVGETVTVGTVTAEIVQVLKKTKYFDEDGITHDQQPYGVEFYEKDFYLTWVRPVPLAA